ncbi:hypothetical protein [Trinickia violacea]|nr:hypothetical protein [Trinickia violacea]
MRGNTSASANFKGSSNGNLPGDTNVSKVNVHTLLYPGHTTKVLVHYLPWWGPSPRGVDVRYRSDDPDQIRRTFTDMTSRGIDGVVVDWYGSQDFVETAWRKSAQILGEFPNLSFSIMVDSGVYKFHRCQGCDLTQTILYYLRPLSKNYFSNPQYLRYSAQPVVFEFGMDAVGDADWAKIQAAFPEILWVHIHKQGFDLDASRGAFAWIDAPAKNSILPSSPASRLTSFYRYAHTEPAKLTVGAAYKGFDDSLAPWGKENPKHIDQSCGETWLRSFYLVNSQYSVKDQLPFLQLITWNDYEEGTALESGIDNCATLSVLRSGKSIDIQLSHASTIDHIVLLRQKGNELFQEFASYPPDTTSIPLPQQSGTYFVQAIGKPFLKNTISNSIVIP